MSAAIPFARAATTAGDDKISPMSIESRTLSVPQNETPTVKTVYLDTSKPKLDRAMAALERLIATSPKGSGKAVSEYRDLVKQIAEEGLRQISSPG